MAERTGVARATGRPRDEWFELLDAWGATRRSYRAIADWLTGAHDLTRWWAQKLTVEYQQARGTRAPGVRRDGTFEVTASKTVAVPLRRLVDAFVNPRERKKWLTDGRMSLRTVRPGRSARFAWDDGASRVSVDFTGKGRAKSIVAVAHAKLPSASDAKRAKAAWRRRLNALKARLEA